MKIGYLGKSPVTFSYQAALSLGDLEAELKGYGTHREIYEAVRSRQVDRGILALENQLAGAVDESLHAIIQPILTQAKPLSECQNFVRISKEVAVPVELVLLNKTGKLEDVAVVMTHPVPMRQAQSTLDELFLRHAFTRETCASTDAAALAASNDPSIAAGSSTLAADTYGLKPIVLRDDPIHGDLYRLDDPIPGASYKNVTRFWVIEPFDSSTDGPFDPVPLEESDEIHKICLLFNLERDESGALAKSLQVFADAGINLANIYPLPRRDRSWEYTFVLEFEVPREAIRKVSEALDKLHRYADYTLLGVYPRYRLPE